MGKLIVSNAITVNGAFESPSSDTWLAKAPWPAPERAALARRPAGEGQEMPGNG
jgi:hypothetical protein